MQISTNFSVKELVDPETVEALGERARNVILPFLPVVLEKLREYTGSITVNDYEWGGNFKYSGTRPYTYKKGAAFSSHRYGNTTDCKFKGITPLEVQTYILDNPDDYPHIVRMEDAAITKTWLHIETGFRSGDIKVFKP